jgi:hypothetical protein
MRSRSVACTVTSSQITLEQMPHRAFSESPLCARATPGLLRYSQKHKLLCTCFCDILIAYLCTVLLFISDAIISWLNPKAMEDAEIIGRKRIHVWYSWMD